MIRSPEAKIQTTHQAESPAKAQEATPLFDSLMHEYIQNNSGVGDLETVTSDTGAAVAVLLEGVGSDVARNEYKDVLNAIPSTATENEIPVHLEMAYHAARQLDPTFPRVAAFYRSGEKTFWNGSNDEETTGLAIVSDSRGVRLGENENAGVINELLPGYKIVVADNRLLDQLEHSNALTIKGIVNDDGSRELYPLYGVVMVSPSDLGVRQELIDIEASQQVKALEENMSPAERRLNEKRVRNERRVKQSLDATSSSDEEPSDVNIMQAFADDQALQAEIKAAQEYALDSKQGGFTVVDKRARTREELLYTPLDELNASIRRAAPKPPLPDHTPTNHLNVIDAPKPPLPDHTPTNHLNVIDVPKPPLPDYEPTNHLNTVDALGNNAPESISWRDKLRHSLAYLGAKLASERMIRQNKREERGLSRERFGSDKQERGLKIAIGAVGVALVAVAAYRLGWEAHAGSLDPTTVNLFGGSGSESGPNEAVDAAAEHARQIDAQHLEILKSPVHTIPNAGGGEAYTLANGADASLWYQNQDEFLQLFPDQAYRMSDGNVGFSHPGELSNSAKEYWAKKFGKWL
jgi:hypothetical protein